MQGKQILIAGCGKIGFRLATQLAKENQVWGLKRTIPSEKSTVNFIQADLSNQASLDKAFNGRFNNGFDFLIYCLTPGERSEQAYRRIYVDGFNKLLSSIPKPENLKRVYFISSTSVYHQDDQSWVDEESPTKPCSFSGKILLEAENLLHNLPCPGTTVRFSGIYGGNRSRLIEQIKKQEISLSSQSRVTNRIHEEDCIGFLQHLIQQEIAGITNQCVYLATDSLPVEFNEVLSWIAKQVSVAIKTDENTAPSRRSGNKFCSNKRMLESGYQLQFPTFKEGYLGQVSAKNN